MEDKLGEGKQGVRFLIQGRVQGVFFLANTQKKAQALGVSGWVSNTNDGHVEVLAFGSTEQLTKLATWLEHGPDTAQVDQLTQASAPWENYNSLSLE